MKKIIEEQLNCICEPTEIIDNESEYRFRRNIAGSYCRMRRRYTQESEASKSR